MNPKLIAAIIFVTLALIMYTIGIFKEFFTKKHSFKNIFIFQTAGILFDITGTYLMFIITPGFSWTLHAFISLAGLFFMVLKWIYFIIIVKTSKPVCRNFKWISLIIYTYWLFIFLNGSSMM